MVSDALKIDYIETRWKELLEKKPRWLINVLRDMFGIILDEKN